MIRVWLRAAVLALAVFGVIAGLTVYFSSENVPRCLVSGARTWRPPTDNETHRYEVVVTDRTACLFDMDDKQKLVGAASLAQAKWLARRVPPASDTVTVTDRKRGVRYVTQRGLLGVRVLDLRTKRQLFVVRFKGFTWNPRFGPDPPNHGLSLAPDRPELWVLDAPNSVVHIFDLSGLPGTTPNHLEDIRFSKEISGDESPCSRHCGRIGSLRHSADGRFVYVGDAGDVIDTKSREIVANLEALHNSRLDFELEWVNGRAFFPPRS
jgi:hypothetical protein